MPSTDRTQLAAWVPGSVSSCHDLQHLPARMAVCPCLTGNKAKKLATLDLVNVQFKVGPAGETLLCLHTDSVAGPPLHVNASGPVQSHLAALLGVMSSATLDGADQ